MDHLKERESLCASFALRGESAVLDGKDETEGWESGGHDGTRLVSVSKGTLSTLEKEEVNISPMFNIDGRFQ